MQSRGTVKHNKEEPKIPLLITKYPSKDRGGHKQFAHWGQDLHEGYQGWFIHQAFEQERYKAHLPNCGF